MAVYYNEADKPCGYMVYLIKSDIMHIKEMIYLNREAQQGLWEYIRAHESMIDEVNDRRDTRQYIFQRAYSL